MALMAYWQIQNQSYYPTDYLRYIRVVMDGYRVAIEQNSIFSGLATSHRILMGGNRGQTLVHVLWGYPFVLLAKGNILRAIALHNGVCFFIFLTYTYMISSEFLSFPKSALATVFIGTVPYIFSVTHTFMSELPFLMTTLASLYHLMRSGFFSDRKHSLLAGIWLGLSLCVRPIETLLMFLLPVIGCVAFGLRKRAISINDCFFGVLLSGVAMCFLLSSVHFEGLFGFSEFMRKVFPVLFLCAVAMYFRKRLRLSLPFTWALVACVSIVSAWQIPLAHTFWHWIWVASFGDSVQEFPVNGTTLLVRIAYQLMGAPFLFLFLVGCFCLFSAFKRGLKISPYVWLPGLTATSMVASMVSRNPDIRYHFSAVCVLFLVLVIVALSENLSFAKARTTLVFAICAYQCAGTAGITLDVLNPRLINRFFSSNYFVLVTPPGREVVQGPLLDGLQGLFPKNRPLRIAIVQPWDIGPGAYIFNTEPDALMLLATTRGLNWSIERQGGESIGNTELLNFLISQKYDYVLVGEPDLKKIGRTAVTPLWESSEWLTRLLRNAVHDRIVMNYGYSYVGQVPITYASRYKSEFLVLQRNDN